MRAMPLRDIQVKGEKALGDDKPILLINRNGPVGILVPVNHQNLKDVEDEIERLVATVSLRQTWKLAAELGLDKLTEEEIALEAKKARQQRIKKHGRKAH